MKRLSTSTLKGDEEAGTPERHNPVQGTYSDARRQCKQPTLATRTGLTHPTPEPVRDFNQEVTMETNGSQPVESEAVKAAIAHHVTGYDRVVSERDELAKKLETAEKLIAVYKIEIEGYRAQAAAESTRNMTYQTERDEAVTRSATVQATIDNIYAIILRSKADASEV